jgi:lactoylglutathione lyase
VFEYVRFATLPVYNQDRALSFYRDLLGLQVAKDEPYQADVRWIELSIAGARTRIWFGARPNEEPASEPSLILVTGDVDGAYRDMNAKGVEFTQVPTEATWSPGERFAMFKDSEGNLLLLVQHIA